MHKCVIDHMYSITNSVLCHQVINRINDCVIDGYLVVKHKTVVVNSLFSQFANAQDPMRHFVNL